MEHSSKHIKHMLIHPDQFSVPLTAHVFTVILIMSCFGSLVLPEEYTAFSVRSAWAESSDSSSKNTLIRRPNLFTTNVVEKDKSLSSTIVDDPLTENQSPENLPFEEEVHSPDSSIRLLNGYQNTSPQSVSSTQEENSRVDSELMTGENPKDSNKESTDSGTHVGVTLSTPLPIVSTPSQSTTLTSSASQNSASGNPSSVSAVTTRRNQMKATHSRKLTQRPEMAKINAPGLTPTPSQPSSSVPSNTTPPLTPSPAPAPAPEPLYSVTLTWNPNTDPDIAGYKIYRKTSPADPYSSPLATIQGNITTFHNTDLKVGTTYYFVVTAFDKIGNESGFSNEVSHSIF